MTNTVRRWRERRERAEAAVFERLDRLEAEEVAVSRVVAEEGEATARRRFPPATPEQEADLVASLIRVSGKDSGGFLGLVDAWADSRTPAVPEEERAGRAIEAVRLRMLTSVTNLFWDEARSGVRTFRADLAAEGRRRGWRR